MKILKKFAPIITLFICCIHIIPIYITATVSLKSRSDSSSFWVFPKNPVWENFALAIKTVSLPRAFYNTLIITVCSICFIILIAAMAAYPLARNKSKWNTGIKMFIVSVMMIPSLSLLVPLYVLLVKFKAVSTYWGIVPIHVTFNLPLAIFLYSNFIGTIPKELDEAALIDGCSPFRIFDRIILPLLKPVTVSIIILTGVAVWNDFQFSVYFLQKTSMRVITLAISSFFGITGNDPHIAAAAALLAIIPITLIYLVLQKYFIRGTIDSAIK